MNTRRLLALAIVLVAVWPQGVPARAAAGAVDEVGRAFQPAEVRIGLGEKVVWTNRSSLSHSVTFPDKDLHPNCDPLLALGCQGPGATAERTFNTPGTYSYYCKLHQSSGMRGTVLVGTVTTTLAATSSTLPAKASSSTATTQRVTSTTTATTRALATSSTLVSSSSTTSTTTEATSVLLPGDPPPFSDDTSKAANRTGTGSKEGSDSGTVALIVGLLLAVSAGGGLLLWRLRPGRP